MEARPQPGARRAARGSGEPRHRRARPVPSGARRGRRGPALALPRARHRPRRRRPGGPACGRPRRHAPPRRCRRLRSHACRGADRGLKGVREGRARVGRRAYRAAPRRGAATVRGQGRRARGRKGRVRLPHPGRAGRRPAGRDGARRRPVDRGAAGGRGGLTVRDQRRRAGGRTRPAQDFKRLGEQDTGPNTGGMGAYSPVPGLSEHDVDELLETVHRPVLAELARREARFTGLLYAGLMLTEDGARVLEFNCRFGDPETEVLLPRIDGDLLPVLLGAATGELAGEISFADGPAVTVVLAGGDYPARSDSGTPIDGVEDAEATGALVFHAGTARQGGRLVTNGGRGLAVTATGDDLGSARTQAYEAASRITFAGMRYRRDIALTAAEGHVRS